MDALAALGVRVVLRSLAAVEHAVVAHHAHAAQSGAVGHRELVLEAFGGRVVVPRNQQDQIARREHGVEEIPLENAVGARIRPISCAQSAGLPVSLNSAGRFIVISVIVVPSPTSVSSRRCSTIAWPVGTSVSFVTWPTRRW